MARRAGEPRLGFRCVNLLSDRPIESTVEEYGVIVATGAPLRGPGADDVLHVLDGFAVPLVVERGEMVDRRAPLVVDVTVAPGTALCSQEKICRNRAVHVRVRR